LSDVYNDSIFDFLLGKAFKKGGRGPDEYDCYGLHEICCKHIGKPSVHFDNWLKMAWLSTLMLRSFENKFIKLEKPKPFCMVLFKAKRGWHIGTVLPSCKQYIHIRRGITVCKQRISDVSNPIEGYYEYAETGSD